MIKLEFYNHAEKLIVMRGVKIIFILLFSLFIIGCKSKYSAHEIVNINEHRRTSDDDYIKFLNTQIDQFPKAEGNYIKLANIYNKQGEQKKSFNLLFKANKEVPESVNIFILLSELYLEEGNAEELSITLKKIQKIAPDNIDFLKMSAAYSLLLKDYTNAIFFTNRALLINPYDNENLFLRGSGQLMSKDSLSALASFEEAYKLKKSYNNFKSIYYLFLNLKEYGKAKLSLEDFESKNAKHQLCFEWGVYYKEIGKMDSSKMILLNCLSKGINESRIDLELAKIYFDKGDVDSTFFYVNKFIALNPKGIDGYVLKAKALEKVLYYTEARSLFSKALEIDSTSTLAINGLENLERKVAYLRIKNRKEENLRQIEILKPLNSREIN